MQNKRIPLMSIITALAVGGSCFNVGGCDLASLAANAVKNINPCGTILACDPQDYAFITSGIDGPGVQPDIDPFCVFPPFCDWGVDPIFGGLTAATP